MNFVLDAIEQGLQADVIFTDFTTTFDRVDHSILMETLSRTSFREPFSLIKRINIDQRI